MFSFMLHTSVRLFFKVLFFLCVSVGPDFSASFAT